MSVPRDVAWNEMYLDSSLFISSQCNIGHFPGIWKHIILDHSCADPLEPPWYLNVGGFDTGA